MRSAERRLGGQLPGLMWIGFRNPNSGNRNLSAAGRIVDSIRDIVFD
jgi:hypothetical protein